MLNEEDVNRYVELARAGVKVENPKVELKRQWWNFEEPAGQDYGQTLNDRNMLFEDVAKEWLFEHKKSNVKESTFEQIEVIVRLHILPYFGNKRIMRIHRPEIKRWIAKFGEIDNEGNEKYSFGSRLKYLSVLKSIFHYAVHELEVLEKNPADRLKVPVQDSVALKKDVKYFSLKELNTLLEYMMSY